MSMVGKVARSILSETGYLKLRDLFLKPKFWRVKSNKTRYNQIVVIGDSHSRFFTGARPETEVTIHIDENGEIHYDRGSDRRFCAFDLGPGLAYNLNRKGTTVRVLEKYEWLSKNLMWGGDIVICAFGEIDIRAHVMGHVTDQNTYKDVVDTICLHYAEFLKIIEKDGYLPVVWGPIASQKDEWRESAQNPAVGSEIDRNKAVIYFNEKMMEFCKQNKWGFMSIYKNLIDEDFRTKGKYIYDGCHLGDNAKVLFEPEFLKCKDTLQISVREV